MKTHYVYEIRNEGKPIYIGRSIYPRARWRRVQKTYPNCTYTIICSTRILKFAQMMERASIAALRPSLNKYIASSPARLGKKNGPKQKRATKVFNTGRKFTDEHKKRLWEFRSRRSEDNSFYGKHHSLRTKQKISEATHRQFSNKESRDRHRLACIAAVARRRALGLPFGRANKY